MIKKGRICFGLLLLLFTMLGLSLSVSSDVSALKYAYNKFPLIRDLYTNCTDSDCTVSNSITSSSNFGVSFESSSSQSYYSKFDDFSLSGFTRCNNVSNSIFDSFFNNERQRWSFGSNSSFERLVYSNQPDFCFGQASSYAFDGLLSASYNVSNGDTVQLVSLPISLFDSTDPLRSSGRIKSLTVPLTLDPDTFSSGFSSGTLLEWDFGLVQKSANNFPYFDPNTRYEFTINYFTENPATSSFSDFYSSYVSDTGVCTVNDNYVFTVRSDSGWEDYLGFNYHCVYTAPSSMFNVAPSISLYGSTGASYNSSVFLEYDYNGCYFTGTFLTTNGDSTWSGQYANSLLDGSNIQDAPGYHQIFGYDENVGCSPGDFLCDLSHLFTFGFFNPFAPIFQMFSDNNSCASIPTLASMIHSEETEVCPWFDSSIRNIVTPVLGLSSMMLVFGFAVRWLGARSGNFIEDSGGVDSGGYHFENKYRRKK